MIKSKRLFSFILKQLGGFLFLKLGGVHLLKLLNKEKPVLIVLNYHNFSKYNNYSINRGDILKTGYSANFSKQMGFLKKHFNFVYPEDFFEANNNNNKGINVLVTFDDGYKDNYDIAFPILKKYNVKSIFFVVTNSIDTENWLEHDQLRYLVQTGQKSEVEIEDILKKMNQGHSISDWITKNKNILNVPEHRLMMNWNEIRELDQNGLKIGPHTNNHKILSFLDIDNQENEIHSSISTIKKELNTSPKYFAYPNGLYNNDTLSILEKSDIQYSFTTKPGFNTIVNNAYLFKRIGINPSDSVGVLLLKLFLNRKK